jgi:hypothetical protein
MSGRGLFRIVVAVIGVGAFAVIAASTNSDADDERASLEPSAIRLAQIYTEGAFYAVVAVGVVLSAYVLSRAGEGEPPRASVSATASEPPDADTSSRVESARARRQVGQVESDDTSGMERDSEEQPPPEEGARL